MNRWATSTKALAQPVPVCHDTWQRCYCKCVLAHVSEFWALGHPVKALLSSNSEDLLHAGYMYKSSGKELKMLCSE